MNRTTPRPQPAALTAVALLISMLTRTTLAQDDAPAAPNVIVILADDMGWGDLSAHGNRNLHTPHIDSLARDGAQLTNFYVCAVCAPTRAEFLTGRYYPKTGVSGVSEGQGRLNPDEITLADVLHDAGYATGAFGKWHNGTQPPYHPCDRGFDEFYGFTSGHWGHYFSPPLDHNRQRVRGRGFLPDDITDRALAFIDAHRDGPFFCYVPFNTPHSPMMVPDRFYDKFAGADLPLAHRDPAKEDLLMTRAALALCENLDWNVGRLLQRLEQRNLADNTIVVFLSDNGPNSWRWNGGMKGRKGSIDEGGLRSPCFWRWPGRIAAGHRVTRVCGAIDLLPTLCQLTAARLPARRTCDGRDVSSLLLSSADDPSIEQRLLYSVRREQVSVRSQQFRLDNEGRLFDISRDRGQTNNVADQFPAETRRLQRAADAFRVQMLAAFDRYRVRPFTVGYGPQTTLPARDGIGHGQVKRSSRAPNNSFFENWVSTDDSITWQVDVGQPGTYEVIVHYTCRAADVGCRLRLSDDRGHAVAADVSAAFDPPLYDKSKERVPRSHYFVKDFRPLRLGTLTLEHGQTVLRLSADSMPGERVVDVHSIDVNRVSPNGKG